MSGAQTNDRRRGEPLAGARAAHPRTGAERRFARALDAESERPSLSVIVPTKDEAGNVGKLVHLLEQVLPGVRLKIIFVDDSSDGTPEEIRRLQRTSSREISLIHRPPSERRGGLGGAVVKGIRSASARWVCVMDADLQHPPELIERLLQRAERGDVDVVVASRFCEEGSVGSFGPIRSGLARVSRAAARIFFPKQLRAISDPMSGFFLLRSEAVDLDGLRPSGFKILLEIVVRNPRLQAAEVGFHFGRRHAGKSKASVGEGLRYLAQVGRLRLGAVLPRFGRFGVVGASGLVVNTLLLAALVDLGGLYYLAAAIVATQGSTLWNFIFTELWVFSDRKCSRRLPRRAAMFFLFNNASLLVRGPLLLLLTSGVGIHYALSNVATLVILAFVRFGAADGWIWAKDATPEGSAPYRYDIHGIVTVGSEVRLPELERFIVDTPLPDPTVRVRIGKVRPPLGASSNGNGATWPGDASRTVYTERGGFGAEIHIDGRVEVVGSPLLKRSPHVLYTNVVEPTLRWTFAEKGYALVHAACIADGDRAFLLTARTDTGKTTTCLKTLEAERYSFLSDDLTLVAPDGRVLTYPKPLTISRHTMKAVRTPLLSRRERAALLVQSRLHSRSGRRFALMLVRAGIPAASINAITQLLIPPPKYHVERLIPGAEIASEARLAGMIVLERGGEGEKVLDPDEALAILLSNCEDAYGFPPYPRIEGFLHSRNGTDLRRIEREIVARALAGKFTLVLRSTTMDWALRLPGIMTAGTGSNGAGGSNGAAATRNGGMGSNGANDVSGSKGSNGANGAAPDLHGLPDEVSRALLSLTNRHRLDDDALASYLRASPAQVAQWRADALRRAAPEVGASEPAESGDVGTGVAVPVEERQPHWRRAYEFAVRSVSTPRLLGAAMVVGAFVRLWHIDSLGFNSDEAVYSGQGAAIANDPELHPLFPAFRAHPLLFQTVLSLGFHVHLGALFGRLLAVAIGVATVYLAFVLARFLYGERAGLIAALVIALMPYHVVVTRQVLLDGPMVLFATLTLYLVARFAASGRASWLHAAGAAMGLTFLTKETSIVLVGAVYAFLALSPSVRLRLGDVARSVAVMVAVMAVHPLSLMFTGKAESGGNYLIWQLFRRPNHDWDFYATTVPSAIGALVIAAAAIGLWLLRREGSWRETLLLCWIAVPVVFFQLWPVKGFQYLLPVAPAVAVLAARSLGRLWPAEGPETGPDGGARPRRVTRRRRLAALATALMAVSLLVPAWQEVNRSASPSFLAGAGGVPGGRSAGEWIKRTVPEGARFMTIGPSMANILQFYGHRQASGLSVSPNPLHRNPSYKPLANPDDLIRNNELQYVVWDAFSAERTPFFAAQLLRYADRYNARLLHTESIPVTTASGAKVLKPVIKMYEVRP